MHHTVGPSSSPLKKRQRLSSPTSELDDQFSDFSPEDIEALNQLEPELFRLSNTSRTTPIEKASSPAPGSSGRENDPDNPFRPDATKDVDHPDIPGFKSAFKLASVLPPSSPTRSRSPSPEVPPERDYSSWFTSDNSFSDANEGASLALFQTARTVVETPTSASRQVAGYIAPSEDALKQAREKIKAWQEDDFPDAPQSPRPVLQSVANLTDPATGVRLSTHTQAHGFIGAGSTVPQAMLESDRTKFQHKPKPFKSPLLTESKQPSKSSLTHTNSPLNPHRLSTATSTKASQHPSTSTPAPPLSRLGARSGVKGGFTKPKFVTPFKPGMRPGDPAPVARDRKSQAISPFVSTTDPCTTPAPDKVETAVTSNVSQDEADGKLCLPTEPTAPTGRPSLRSCGLRPQKYTTAQLEGFGINVSQLSQISPALALYYSFHKTSSSPSAYPESEQTLEAERLGPAAALSELHRQGCNLATKEWVENHWGLILWKLAGLVMLDPEKEVANNSNKRWCWDEVMRQLLYRYQRELESAQRPALRLITTQDAPPSSPLVLCVSDIIWSEAGVTEDGERVASHPELEVTDGWYRLRAQIDAPLARAVKKGSVNVGRKIGVVGAKLSTERKEPLEVLEAYNSTKLVFTGNSSQLVPWHEKLGFRSGRPPVCTMNKLTPDGGVVAVMDLTIVKVHPVGFLEIIEDDDGKKRKSGLWDEKEEARLVDKWRAKREAEASKIRDSLEKKLMQMEGWIERLMRKAGDSFTVAEDDSIPDHIENVYDDLEGTSNVAPIFAKLSGTEAGWLANYIREKIVKDKERMGYEIENELNDVCPPRQVRNFCVLIVKDACARRRPANRQAQLTVWDATGLTSGDSAERAGFKQGQRFRVTNVFPQQTGAWMGREEGAEIFLSTGRTSTWTRIQ